MKILYLGNERGTSKHRAEALVRLGHQVQLLDPELLIPSGRLASKLHWETGGLLCEKIVTAAVLSRLEHPDFDLTVVNGGRYVGPSLVTELQRRFGPVLNYNNDDPFGGRDRFSWALYLRTLAYYDLTAVLREPNVAEAKARGAKKVVRVWFSADEAAHAPRVLTAEDEAQWGSEVVFVGTWMPERGPFMAELLERGVPLRIYGGRWQKAPEWPALQSVWKGPGTKTNDEYAKAIQASKICLGLLSKGNRDLHTQRSLEVPYLGGLLCGERTTEHQQLYEEGQEAVFWNDAAECAEVCHALLTEDGRRQEIARLGQLRCRKNETLNEPVMAFLLEQVS